MTAAMVKSASASIEREGFEGKEIERRHELASTALAAQAQAEVQARYVMAMQRPRSFDDVRVKLLKECKRPGFAERAFYSIPRAGAKPGRLTGASGRVEGLSVRFAERALAIAGNMWTATRSIYDDDFKRQINVSVTDLESNTGYGRDIIIEKTVERARPKDGSVILGQRENSAGEQIYIVQATEDEMLQKEGNLVSRRFRTEGLRMIPPDILEECERTVVATVRAQIKEDPDAERKRIADAFATLSVMPSDLSDHLGHDLGQASPAELESLRGLYQAIRDGEITWAEIMAERAKGTVEIGSAQSSRAQAVAEKLKERTSRGRAAKPTAPETKASDQGQSSLPMPSKQREPGEEG